MTEEEMENPGALSSERKGVASSEKHASITVVVPSHSNPSLSTEPSPINDGRDISGSNNNRPSPSNRVSTNVDKINNLVQKESALGRVGVTREKAYQVIYDALEATHWVDEYDEQGNCRRVLRPHVQRRQWGSEIAIKMFGDMIERKEIEHDIGDRTLDRFRAMSVADLKARCADILLGKKGQIIEAEVTRAG